MSLPIYLSADGDGIGQLIGRMLLADNIEQVRQVSSNIEKGNKLITTWALNHGGNVISAGGDECCVCLSADYLSELPDIRRQYTDITGATLSVGVGVRVSESSKALMVSKLQGKDRVTFYSEDCDDIIQEALKPTEVDKITDEYLRPINEKDDFKESTGINSIDRDSKPIISQGSREEAIHALPAISPPNTLMSNQEEQPEDSNRPNNRINKAETHPEKVSSANKMSIEEQLHHHAKASEEQDKNSAKDAQLMQIKQQLVHSLQILKDQAPMLEQIKQEAPHVYQSMVGLANAVIGMAHQVLPENEEPEAEPDTKPDTTEDSDSGKAFHHGALPKPHGGHKRITMPVGSIVGTREKIQHQDGTTGWVSLKSGAIMSRDGHPISSKTPEAK